MRAGTGAVALARAARGGGESPVTGRAALVNGPGLVTGVVGRLARGGRGRHGVASGRSASGPSTPGVARSRTRGCGTVTPGGSAAGRG